jgi:hypothetical protein
MNRFSNYSVSAYTPMTMQEIMMTPLAMREQHNKTQSAIDLQNAELDKINALPVHTEEAVARKNELLKSINALSSDLANKGFSNDMTTNLIKLNRQVKDEFSPQGRLGQINNAYSTYFKNLEDFKKSNEDKKWSQQEFDLNWNKHKQNYLGYDEKGNITNIDSLSAPEKVTIENKWKELSAIIGDSKIATDILTGNADLVSGPNGSLVTVTTKDGEKLSYNNPQVVAALNQIHGELNDPTSDLSKSRIYAGQSIEKALNEAMNLGMSKIDISKGRVLTTDKDVQGYKNSYDLADEQAANAITMVNTEESSADVEGSIGENITKFNILNTKGFNNLTDDEKEEYISVKGMIDNYNAIDKSSIKDYKQVMKSNGKPAYVHYANELGIPGTKGITLAATERVYNNSKDKFLSKYKKGTKEYEFAKDMLSSNDLTKTSAQDKIAYQEKYEKVLNDFSKNVAKKQKIYNSYKNDIFTHQNKYNQYYTPLSSDSEKGTGKMLSLIDEQLSKTMKSPTGSNAFSSITQVTTENGEVLDLRKGDMLKNITENRANINKVMQTADKLEFIDLTDNDKGYPAMRFKIYPNKDTNSSEKISGSSSWSDGVIGRQVVGGDKPFTVTVRLGDFTNIKSGSSSGYGTNSSQIELLKLIMEKGGEQGKAIASAALNRIQSNR